MDMDAFKRGQMEELAVWRDKFRVQPQLRQLFFELTDRCNLACRHCGSNCRAGGLDLDKERIFAVLDNLAPNHPPESTMICLTGGEPMLHPDFFPIVEHITELGYPWGMTTNATLIDDDMAKRLRAAGMGSVGVSLDGPEAEHDWLRRSPGAYSLAVRGISALIGQGYEVQVTTVVHKGNFDKLEETFRQVRALHVASWRPINIEPIGRARESELLLDDAQLVKLIEFIREKRFSCPDMEVTYGCSHMLPLKHERMVRDHYFMCMAGIEVAGIRSNGDIGACLDIERRPELVEGNIYRDDFNEVWEHGFQFYRQDRTERSEKCRACPDRDICAGDSTHTWDFDRNEPMLCLREVFARQEREEDRHEL